MFLSLPCQPREVSKVIILAGRWIRNGSSMASTLIRLLIQSLTLSPTPNPPYEHLGWSYLLYCFGSLAGIIPVYGIQNGYNVSLSCVSLVFLINQDPRFFSTYPSRDIDGMAQQRATELSAWISPCGTRNGQICHLNIASRSRCTYCRHVAPRWYDDDFYFHSLTIIASMLYDLYCFVIARFTFVRRRQGK